MLRVDVGRADLSDLRERGLTTGLAVTDQEPASWTRDHPAEGKQRLLPIDHPLINASRNVSTCFGD